MNQVLSQDEIDALLKGISDGDVETEKEVVPPPPEVEAQTYDFIKVIKAKKEKLPALQFVYDRFSKAFASALSLFMEREVEMLMAPMEYLEYNELVKALPLPTNMNVVSTENPKGFFIVVFDAKLIFSVLESIFGGSELSAPKVEGREFTKIEVKVIKKLIDIVCTEMEKAWNPVFQMQCTYSRSEMNPNYVTMVAPEEIINLTEFTISMENMNSWMKVCVPWALLEPIKGYLVSTPSREDREMRERWVRQLKEKISEIPLDLKAVLGRKKLSLQEFKTLNEEAVFMVDKHMDDPISIEIGGKERIWGRVGSFKGNKAIMVEEVATF
jgi:flagellar motor switch protein FliM